MCACIRRFLPRGYHPIILSKLDSPLLSRISDFVFGCESPQYTLKISKKQTDRSQKFPRVSPHLCPQIYLKKKRKEENNLVSDFHDFEIRTSFACPRDEHSYLDHDVDRKISIRPFPLSSAMEGRGGGRNPWKRDKVIAVQSMKYAGGHTVRGVGRR